MLTISTEHSVYLVKSIIIHFILFIELSTLEAIMFLIDPTIDVFTKILFLIKILYLTYIL
jgi:hypothetical protein